MVQANWWGGRKRMAAAHIWTGLCNQPWLFLPSAVCQGTQAHGPPYLVSLPGTGRPCLWSILMPHSHSPSPSQRGWVRSTRSMVSPSSP